ncbi:MAG TPA: hypothetical protein VF746_18590 [Longimicrobium sp.]|jgi:hypothetical protein
MSPLAWAAAGALVGLGAALVLVRSGLVPFGRRRPENEPGAADGGRVRLAHDDLRAIRDDIQGLHVVRGDLRHIAGLLERLLEETMAFQRTRVIASRPEPADGSTRDAFREPVRETSPEPSPIPGAAAWSAHTFAQPREPSPDAVSVEASNDAVVPSVRHPPEAWLERRGGEGEVWLNPRVALTDPALQRWSTFFDWERREPGARYQADRPAVVTWSASGGSVLRKGVARPL